MFNEQQVASLGAKLHPDHVKSRSQAGRSLSYLEGWHVIAEANRIFGFDGWTRETVETRLVSESERKIGQQQRPGWGVTYICRVRVVVGGVVREGTGAGHGIDVDRGLAHESAIKEAETDAMKRALMTFGNPFGLALYDKERANVGVDEPEPESEPAPTQDQLTKAKARTEFADLGRQARKLTSEAAIDEFLLRHEAAIARMPADWRPHWNRLINQVRQAVSQRQAA